MKTDTPLSNPQTGELCLRLPAPYSNIIITPPRATDAAAIVDILNDMRVTKVMQGPPYPYKLEHAESWLARVGERCKEVATEWHALKNDDSGMERKVISGCPVRSIREVQKDGSELYIGDINIERSTFFQVVDNEEAAKLQQANNALKTGDPEIVWMIGDYLSPTHHARGIMTAVVWTVLHDFMVPHMGVRHVIVTAMKGNVGSVRVFEKNGFRMIDTIDDCKTMAESKGGGRYGQHILEWRMPDDP